VIGATHGRRITIISEGGVAGGKRETRRSREQKRKKKKPGKKMDSVARNAGGIEFRQCKNRETTKAGGEPFHNSTATNVAGRLVSSKEDVSSAGGSPTLACNVSPLPSRGGTDGVLFPTYLEELTTLLRESTKKKREQSNVPERSPNVEKCWRCPHREPFFCSRNMQKAGNSSKKEPQGRNRKVRQKLKRRKGVRRPRGQKEKNLALERR